MTTSTEKCPTFYHNLDSKSFIWLFAKYVRTINPKQHCTNVIHGLYSKKLSRHNELLSQQPAIVLDELPPGSYGAIYLCGVAAAGYRQKLNYPHNLHAAIRPEPGARDRFVFERWELEVEHGRFWPIPAKDALPLEYASLPREFTTCRIFRWAVTSGLPLCPAARRR